MVGQGLLGGKDPGICIHSFPESFIHSFTHPSIHSFSTCKLKLPVYQGWALGDTKVNQTHAHPEQLLLSWGRPTDVLIAIQGDCALMGAL